MHVNNFDVAFIKLWPYFDAVNMTKQNQGTGKSNTLKKIEWIEILTNCQKRFY